MSAVHGDRARPLTLGCHRLATLIWIVAAHAPSIRLYSDMRRHNFVVINAHTTARASAARATYHFHPFMLLYVVNVVSYSVLTDRVVFCCPFYIM